MRIVSPVSTHTYSDDNRLVPIGIAAALLGVSVSTVRRYEADGKITGYRTLGNQRRYRVGDLLAAANAVVRAS